MNTQPDFTRQDPDPEAPDLADVMGMLARLGTTSVMGRDGRRLALALSDVDVEALDGLVIQGETYEVRWRQEWAACRCGDGKHEWRRDAPHAREHWHQTRRDAEEQVKRAQERRVTWEPRSPEVHLVSHIVAVSGTEVVR